MGVGRRKKGSKYKRERWRIEVGVGSPVCVCGSLAFMHMLKRMARME